ncbi:hypothetical protein PC119_g21619 [Phytophthora cactorum]|nr:hypothetical protein PC114_g17767 [Phytophthora cactorum]KAG2978957.1 hypothetical protein PC119_g21619 [Phytophthora cactorum]KAG4042901.1 hypothetical protein PC123_g21621 [Phytophthora cactorum]
MVYDMDFVHSAIFAKDAALVDQQINDGASFNPDLVYGQGRVGVLLTFVVTSAIIRCLLISNSAACMMHGFMYSKEDAVTVSGYDLTNYPIKATAITGVISATPVSNAYLMNALPAHGLRSRCTLRDRSCIFLFDTPMFSSENFPLISSECGDFVVVSKPTVLLQNNDSTL